MAPLDWAALEERLQDPPEFWAYLKQNIYTPFRVLDALKEMAHRGEPRPCIDFVRVDQDNPRENVAVLGNPFCVESKDAIVVLLNCCVVKGKNEKARAELRVLVCRPSSFETVVRLRGLYGLDNRLLLIQRYGYPVRPDRALTQDVARLVNSFQLLDLQEVAKNTDCLRFAV